MNNRRSGTIAALGCVAVLILIILPVALVVWVFGAGGFGLPPIGMVQQTQQIPQQEDPIFEEPAGDPTATPELPAELQETPEPALPSEPQDDEDVIPPTGTEGSEQPILGPPNTLAELYERVSPGTVSILVGAQRGQQLQGGGAGSGFVLSEEGYIVTNHHVLAGGDVFIVRFFNDIDVQAELVGSDPDSDLAILRVAELPEDVSALPMGDSNTVQVGESVIAIGNPFALGTSMSYGIVSAVGRTIPSGFTQFNIPQAIQTDAAINPGNSGGPLINMEGEVIGINAQIRTSGQGGGNIGIGFAIPVNILRQIAPSLIERGVYRWAYLGVTSGADSPLAQQPQDRDARRGALISEVVPNGPAAQGGMRSGDVVIRAGDQEIRNFTDLLTYIAFHQPGDEIPLTVLRDGQEQQLTITLGERPGGGLQ
jgi:S1-C subfamily serine protease